MNEWILFTIGLLIGSAGGLMTMALVSANKFSRMNDTIFDLKKQIFNNQPSKPKPRKYRKKA